MIIEYIRRKLTQVTASGAENDRLNALYDIAAHGHVIPRSRLSEISERYCFTPEEQQQILPWAQAQVEGVG